MSDIQEQANLITKKMESGASGEPMASQEAIDDDTSISTDEKVMDDIVVLREQWNALSEYVRNTDAGIQLGEWITRVENKYRRLESMPEEVPRHLAEAELDRKMTSSQMEIQVHQFEIDIMDLQTKLKEAGRLTYSLHYDSECYYENRTEILRSIENEITPRTVKLRIVALDRKIAYLEKMLQVQTEQINNYTGILNK